MSSPIPMPTKSILLASMLALACQQNSEPRPAERPHDPVADWICSEVSKTMTANDIPAVSIAVIRDGQVSLVRGFGHRKRGHPEPVDGTTIYQIASLSKMFTGIIANRLAKDGALDVQSPLARYLPISTSSAARAKLAGVRVENVLHHQSGLPRGSAVVNRVDGDPMLEAYTETQITQDLESLRLESEPGSRFGYSNLGYGFLGFALGRASGRTYANLVETIVCTPFGMTNTAVHLSDAQRRKLATPYRKDDRRVETRSWNTGYLAGASGVYSTAEDLSKLMAAQLAAYRRFETEKATNPLILTASKAARRGEGSYYGYGIFEDRAKRGTVFGHGGDMDGYASAYSFNPEKNVGVVILTSSGGRWLGYLAAILMKKLEENAAS